MDRKNEWLRYSNLNYSDDDRWLRDAVASLGAQWLLRDDVGFAEGSELKDSSARLPRVRPTSHLPQESNRRLR